MKYSGQESSKLEFKVMIPAIAKIIRTVIAFCNAKGGKLVIGVKDDRTIEGVSEEEAHLAMEWLDHAIYEACTPPILPLIYQQRIDGKMLLIIEVSSGTNKIIKKEHTTDYATVAGILLFGKSPSNFFRKPTYFAAIFQILRTARQLLQEPARGHFLSSLMQLLISLWKGSTKLLKLRVESEKSTGKFHRLPSAKY